MDHMEELLRRVSIFRKLSLADRQGLAAVAVAQAFAKGETVFREEDPSTFLYTILSGRVKVVKLTPSGQEAILEVFGPGDPLGAVAVYEAKPYPASAVAIEETTCVRIERAAFFSLLEERPSLVRGLLSGLNLRLIELTKRVTELTGGRVENRLARLFLRLSKQFGRPERGGIFIPMPLTRQELADMTGTTVETCIRIMSRWNKEQVLVTEEDGFVLRKPETFEMLADGRT